MVKAVFCLRRNLRKQKADEIYLSINSHRNRQIKPHIYKCVKVVHTVLGGGKDSKYPQDNERFSSERGFNRLFCIFNARITVKTFDCNVSCWKS